MPERTPAEIEAIKAALVGHLNWLRRKGGKRADLSFRDLSGLTLERVDLTGAKLSGASLCGTKLAGANLSQADLFGADLEGANLTGANLAAADLRGANLHKAALTDAILRGADLRAGSIMTEGGGVTQSGAARLTEARMERSILAGANFSGCDLSGADLGDADLSGAQLSGAVLIGTDLTGAILDGVAFNGTVIDEMSLSQTYIPFVLPADALAEPACANMSAEAFLEAVADHERWVESHGAEGRRLDLDMVKVADSKLTGRVLAAARMRRCRFPGAVWHKIGLEMADLSYTNLEGADLREANLRGVVFRRAYLAAARMGQADAGPLPLAGGQKWPANFDGADLSFADLRHARMGEAQLGSAKLDGAKLDGSGINIPEAEPRPPRPTVPTEQRRHKRYVRPTLIVQTERGTLHTRNWSLGGMCLRVYDVDRPFVRGESLKTQVVMADRADVQAPAEITVVATNPRKGHINVRFDRYGEELKTLLKVAFQEFQRLNGA